MKRTVACLLALVSILSALCGCSTTAQETTAPSPAYSYPEIHQKLTWEAINAFPIKSAEMTEEELRTLCVGFFEFSKTALWIPDTTWHYTLNKNGNPDTLQQGQIYGGLPYIGVSSGNIYRLMDYIDEETGVVDMTEPMANPNLFGNQCSIGSYWGWARVINSADFGWTYEMVHARGFLRVGPYTYPDSLIRFKAGSYETGMVIRENGEQIMCQSYAAMKKADGLVTSGEAGHAMMCYSDPVVVYAEDGTIDGNQSYLQIIDQHSIWTKGTNQAGDTFQYKNFIGKKFTFNELMVAGYIPFTFAEFQGTDPVEETVCTFSHTGDSITPDQLMAGEVTANYGLSDIYAVLRDAQGNEILRSVKRASQSGIRSLNFYKAVSPDEWEPYASGEYTVEVFCQLGTGERPTVYVGKLTK